MQVGSEGEVRRSACGSFDDGFDDVVESKCLSGNVGFLPASEFDELVDECRHRLEFVVNIVDKVGSLFVCEWGGGGEYLDVGAECGDRGS